MVRIDLPFRTVSYNSYYRVYRGRVVISDAGRLFRGRVLDATRFVPMTKGKVEVTCDFSWALARKRDLDNAQKSILDALKGIAYEDDSMIEVLHSTKSTGIEDRTVVTVVPYVEKKEEKK